MNRWQFVFQASAATLINENCVTRPQAPTVVPLKLLREIRYGDRELDVRSRPTTAGWLRGEPQGVRIRKEFRRARCALCGVQAQGSTLSWRECSSQLTKSEEGDVKMDNFMGHFDGALQRSRALCSMRATGLNASSRRSRGAAPPRGSAADGRAHGPHALPLARLAPGSRPNFVAYFAQG